MEDGEVNRGTWSRSVKSSMRGGHKNVGIVYNWHHGHGHIGDWKESLKLMKPLSPLPKLEWYECGSEAQDPRPVARSA
jgi:hypothetical protein